MGYNLNYDNNSVDTENGVEICELYEPQAALGVKSKDIVVVVGHEEVVVIDTNTNEVLARTYTR